MKHFLILLSLAGLFKVSGQTFNGSIEFKYSTSKDTTTNIYLVKNKVVKLDNYSRKAGGLEGSYIFDLNENKMKFVNPKRKVWGEHKSETAPLIRGVCEVTKGKGSKSVAGVKCKEYTVKNTEENTIISYWIAESNFDFFAPMLKIWNGKYKQIIYYTQIKDLPEGSMPLLSEERQLSDNKVITRLEATKISKKIPDNASMDVPAGYTKFE